MYMVNFDIVVRIKKKLKLRQVIKIKKTYPLAKKWHGDKIFYTFIELKKIQFSENFTIKKSGLVLPTLVVFVIKIKRLHDFF